MKSDMKNNLEMSATVDNKDESDALDAARYRWLREGYNDDLVLKRVGNKWNDVYLPRLEHLDAAIDARMKQFNARVCR